MLHFFGIRFKHFKQREIIADRPYKWGFITEQSSSKLKKYIQEQEEKH